jgi:hypothetical protein
MSYTQFIPALYKLCSSYRLMHLLVEDLELRSCSNNVVCNTKKNIFIYAYQQLKYFYI